MNTNLVINSTAVAAYDMMLHEWELQLKGWATPLRGGLVGFAVERLVPETGLFLTSYYPIAKQKQFAFCPNFNKQEFARDSAIGFKELPKYIVYFNKDEIKSLRMAISQ